jgi:GGDEF domain-containing protein
MISIRTELNDLERSLQQREAVLDCYLNAIRNVAHYALELDEDLTRQFRKHMGALADEIFDGGAQALDDSRATLRGLLRDYRDRSSVYVSNLRDELAGTARALEEILDSLNQCDGDQEGRLRGALVKLRAAAKADTAGTVGAIIAGAAEAIEQSIEQMRKQHQLTVSQFLTEIRVLHQRIDSLEKSASLDQLTRLSNRAEMTERIRQSVTGEYCLILIGVRGLLRAEVQFGKEVGHELAAAFASRLRNSIPTQADAARWSAEDFVVKLEMKHSEATALGKWITDNLSGQYACMKGGKAVRPSVQVMVGVVETTSSDKPAGVLHRVDVFFGGRQ